MHACLQITKKKIPTLTDVMNFCFTSSKATPGCKQLKFNE